MNLYEIWLYDEPVDYLHAESNAAALHQATRLYGPNGVRVVCYASP